MKAPEENPRKKRRHACMCCMLLSFDPLLSVVFHMTRWEFRIATLASALTIESFHEANSVMIADPVLSRKGGCTITNDSVFLA